MTLKSRFRDLSYLLNSKVEQTVELVQGTRTPISLALDSLKIKRRPFVAISNDGLKVRLEPSCGESFTFFETIIRRDYVKNGIKLNSGDTVVDIGANIGCFAILAGSLVGPSGRVFAFEPVPQTYKRLEDNVALNALANVRCVPAAIDSTDGTMTMATSSKSALASAYLSPGPASDASHIEVATITLAEAFRANFIDRVQLLKVDCEGSEYGIFETMTADTAARIDQIAMEVHPMANKSMNALAERLQTLGFSVLQVNTGWFARRQV